jgi:predicted transposase/invertase (TIGR01784 family)
MTEKEKSESIVSTPHDKLFKKIWSDREAARDLLRNCLPEPLRELVDLATLEVRKDSFVGDNLKEFFSDLLYEASLGDRTGYLYLLFEHKSRPERTTGLQLHTYIDRIWRTHHQEKGLPLPPVIPMVLYHGSEKWNFGTDLAHLLDNPDPRLLPYVPNFEFVLFDLSRYADDRIKGEVLTRVGLLLLKHVFSPDYEGKLPEILSLLRSLLEKETGMQYIEAVLRYIFSTAEHIKVDDLKRIVKNKLSESQENTIMTLAERLKQEGREEAWEEAWEEATKEATKKGHYETIEMGLHLRFGKNSEETMSRVYEIDDIDSLGSIKNAVRSLKSLDEIAAIVNLYARDRKAASR